MEHQSESKPPHCPFALLRPFERAPTFDADEQRLADEMKRSWTAFTGSGDPRAAGLPDWPRYEAGGSTLAWRAGGRSEMITDAQLVAEHQCEFWDPLPRQGWTVS